MFWIFFLLPSAIAAVIALLLWIARREPAPAASGAAPATTSRGRAPVSANPWRVAWQRTGRFLVPAAAGGVLVAVAATFVAEDRVAGFTPAPGVEQTLPPWVVYLLYFVAMIVGMVCQTLFDAIKNRRDGDRPSVDPWRLVLPMLISPMVFGLVMGQLGDASAVRVASLILAFQNGFFWQDLMSSLKPGGKPANQPVGS